MYVSLLSLSLTVRAQEGTPAPPIKDSPLIELIKKNENIINLNTLGNFSNYGNTEETDLSRKTVLEHILSATQSGQQPSQGSFQPGGLEPGEENDINYDLPAEILSVDNNDFDLSGYNKIKSLGEKTIILGADTVQQCILVEVTEMYSVRNWLDTISRYENTYYSFVKDGSIVLEIFNKKRLWIGGFVQYFDGVSINTVGQNPPIQILLTPNPASTDCAAQFSLYKSGTVILNIVNQNATVRQEVFKADLGSGNQSISFSVKDFNTGIYTIFLEFDNNIYSANLIIN